MDYGRLAGLYRQYLGRDPEPGAEGWLQLDDDGAIESGIANSGEAEEYRNRQSQPQQQQPEQQQPQQQAPSGLDDNAINQLYQQYLKRGADQSGLNTWRGQSYEQVLQGILGSGEYAQLITNQQAPTTPTTPMNSGAGRNPVTQTSPVNDPNNYDYPPPRLVDSGDGQVYVQDPPTPKAGVDFGTGGVNWILDPNNLAKNAVSWSDYYGQGQYHYADGSTALADPTAPNKAVSVTPPYSAYEDPANKRLGYRNFAYSSTSVPETITINGATVSVTSPELLLNPQGKVFTDPTKGNRTYTIQDVSPKPKDSQTFQVFDTVIKIGAAIGASIAFAPVGMAILESATGLTAAELTATYGAATINAAASSISAGTSSAVNTALQGGDINKILEATAIAAATAGATSGITSGINAVLPDNLPATVSSGIGKGAVGTVTAILGGKDPISGLARGTISGLAGGAVRDIQSVDFSAEEDPFGQVYDEELGRTLTPYEVSQKYPELYPEGIPIEERTFGEKLAGTTATTLAGALSSYFFPSTKPSTGSTPSSGRTVTPSSGAKEVIRETNQPSSTSTSRSQTYQPTPMMATSSASPATSSYFGPSTAALGQALNTGSVSLASGGGGGAGDTGSTGQDISEESGAAPKKKWVNAQSLRDLDEIGS
jgi:hypothetical protein